MFRHIAKPEQMREHHPRKKRNRKWGDDLITTPESEPAQQVQVLALETRHILDIKRFFNTDLTYPFFPLLRMVEKDTNYQDFEIILVVDPTGVLFLA